MSRKRRLLRPNAGGPSAGRKAAGSALAALSDHGCEAAGYRLADAQLDHVCCRHLYGSDRMLTVWPAEDHAVVIAVGSHDQSTEDVYTARGPSGIGFESHRPSPLVPFLMA
jgi:hypothetical protein